MFQDGKFFLSWSEKPVAFDFHDVKITAGKDVAFATGIGQCAGVSSNGKREELEFRLTMCFRKFAASGASCMSTIHCRRSRWRVLADASAACNATSLLRAHPVARKRPESWDSGLVDHQMVAGVRFELTTFGLCDLTQLSLRVGLYLHPEERDARHPVSTPSSLFRGLVRYCRTRTAGLRFHRL